ncbi:hypothetical protein [Streptomyces sp. NPDC006925]
MPDTLADAAPARRLDGVARGGDGTGSGAGSGTGDGKRCRRLPVTAVSPGL